MSTLPFTKSEWDAAMPGLVKDMTSFLRPYRTGVYEDFVSHGEGWGSGSYISLGAAVHILTNEHVSNVRRTGRVLTYQYDGQEGIRRVVGDHFEVAAPYDLALLPVDMASWRTVTHSSQAITVDQIATKHDPRPTEVLAFCGFAGERADFRFGHLLAEATCYLAREVDLPHHPDIDPRFHFGIDYRPDLATTIIGNRPLPTPPGLSGSTVWDTGYVNAKIEGRTWNPTMARVTGVVWGWPSSSACIVATRVEHLRSFLQKATGAS